MRRDWHTLFPYPRGTPHRFQGERFRDVLVSTHSCCFKCPRCADGHPQCAKTTWPASRVPLCPFLPLPRSPRPMGEDELMEVLGADGVPTGSGAPLHPSGLHLSPLPASSKSGGQPPPTAWSFPFPSPPHILQNLFANIA